MGLFVISFLLTCFKDSSLTGFPISFKNESILTSDWIFYMSLMYRLSLFFFLNYAVFYFVLNRVSFCRVQAVPKLIILLLLILSSGITDFSQHA